MASCSSSSSSSFSGIVCCVRDCNSTSDGNRNITFHKFPKPTTTTDIIDNTTWTVQKVAIERLWARNLDLTLPPDPNWRICSEHFKKNDFYPSKYSFESHNYFIHDLLYIQFVIR